MTTWQRATGVVWRRSGDHRILLGPASEEPVILAGSGGVIWDLLAEPTDGPELCSQLALLHGEPLTTLEGETLSFIEELCEAGLVEAL